MNPLTIRFQHRFSRSSGIYETTSPDIPEFRVTATNRRDLSVNFLEAILNFYTKQTEKDMLLSSLTFDIDIEFQGNAMELLSSWIEEDKESSDGFERDIEDFNSSRMSTPFA